MNKICIIGAGQLGSRHLQGVLKYQGPLEVVVVDPSKDSLELSETRSQEITHGHNLSFSQSWEDIPQALDIVIVATNADVREKIVTRLFADYNIKYLVLEKVLFQSLEAMDRVDQLISDHETEVFVNHARRMFGSYAEVKEQLDPGKKTFGFTGGNWGLGCNALHFLDLFSFLSGSEVESISFDYLDQQIYPGKREGFTEFNGTITGLLKDGSSFSITSFAAEASFGTLSIFDNQTRTIVQEIGTAMIYRFKKSDGFQLQTSDFQMRFQSDMSADLVNDLLNKGDSLLPRYSESSQLHRLFISGLLQKYNQFNSSNSTTLPIT